MRPLVDLDILLAILLNSLLCIIIINLLLILFVILQDWFQGSNDYTSVS